MFETLVSNTPNIAPGPQEFPEVWHNPLQVFIEAHQQYGDIVCLDPYEHRMYLVLHPDHVKYVLQDNHLNYRRDGDSFRLLVGNGLIANEGASWLRQRRLMQPAFHRQQIASLASRMVEVTASMLERWEAAANRAEPLDILAEMLNLTTHLIVKTMFGVDGDETVEAAAQAMTIGQDYIYQLGWNYGGENGPDQQQFQQAIETLDQMVYHLIEKRRRSGRQENDLLSMLLQVRDEETHEGMDDRQLRDEIVGIFGAGRDTTAIALAWTWYLLATHPEVERRLQAELSTVLQGRLPTVADLPHLVYTRQIVEESLRLYPPGWMTARMSLSEDEIGGYHIPAQAEIFLSPYITQRHPAFWANPDQFEPGRFASDQAVSRPKFAYYPFGGGPRVCIGSSFAMVELQLVVAIITQAYRRRLAPGAQVELDVRMTLQPKGLQLILER